MDYFYWCVVLLYHGQHPKDALGLCNPMDIR